MKSPLLESWQSLCEQGNAPAMSEPRFTGHGNVDVKEANELVDKVNHLTTENAQLKARNEELEKIIEEAQSYVYMMERHLKPDQWNIEHAIHFQKRASAWLNKGRDDV